MEQATALHKYFNNPNSARNISPLGLSQQQDQLSTNRKTVRFSQQGKSSSIRSSKRRTEQQSAYMFSDSEEDQQILSQLEPKKRPTTQCSSPHNFSNAFLKRIASKKSRVVFQKKRDEFGDIIGSKEQLRNERDEVKALDDFDAQQKAQNQLNIYAENLNIKLRSSVINKRNTKESLTSAQQQNIRPALYQAPPKKKEGVQQRTAQLASLNIQNLNLILADPQKDDEAEKQAEIRKLEEQLTRQSDIQKYLQLDKNFDLFSEEARNTFIKYKVYKAKPECIEGDPDLVNRVKTTPQIATNELFDAKVSKLVPQQWHEDEVVATAMDLYLTINMTENLYNAKLKRKKQRLQEEEQTRMTRIKVFLKQFNSHSVNEKLEIETQLIQEFKNLRSKLSEQKDVRAQLLTINTSLYNQIQELKDTIRREDEQYRRVQLSSKNVIEKKMQKQEKKALFQDMLKLNYEKEQAQKAKNNHLKEEQYLNRLKDVNNERIYYLESEMDILKEQLKFVKNLQKEHYLSLLKEGTDTRHRGLIWIVECLWDLNISANSNHFPNFLDQNSKDFIIRLAEKDYQMGQKRFEASKLKLKIKEIISPQKTIQIERPTSSMSKPSTFSNEESALTERKRQIFTEQGFFPIRNSGTFQNIINQKNRTLKELFQVMEARKKSLPIANEERTINHIVSESLRNNIDKKVNLTQRGNSEKNIEQRYFSGDHKWDQKQIEQINIRIGELEKQIHQLSLEMIQMKKLELRRLVKDYLNPSSNLSQLNSNMKSVLNCIYGDTSMEIEFFRMLKIYEHSRGLKSK